MKQKLILTSIFAISVVGSAYAEPSNTVTGAPANGSYQADTTYTGAATVEELGVYENNSTATANANYEDILYNISAGNYLAAGSEGTGTICPANSYCPGLTNVTYDATNNQGINACPTNYTSDSGASAQNQCYQTCSVNCTQPTAPAHSKNVTYGTETASGRTYYGSSCNAVVPTCSINFDCVTGYHKVSGASYPLSVLASVAGVEVSVAQQLFPGKTTVTEDEIKATLTPEVISMVQSGYQEMLSSMGITHEQFVQTQIIDRLFFYSDTFVFDYGYGSDVYDFSEDDIATKLESLGISGDNATSWSNEYYYRNIGEGSCYDYDNNISSHCSSNSMDPGDFELKYSYGTVKGQATCTTTFGTNVIGTPVENSDDEEFCWCSITGFTPTGGTLQKLSSAHVYVGTCRDVVCPSCASSCAHYCASDLSYSSGWALFASLGATASQ
ncbi:MAG: hypothetical protein MJ158_03250, partial [Alphaproteobacteria bacterium]|nr:hypothetical protein [Alphaproteobacteria bacterium]